MLSLLRIIIVLKHLVEHEVEQLLVRYEKLNKLLALYLREFLNFFGGAGLHDPEVGLEEVRLSSLRLDASLHSGARRVKIL